MAKAFTTKAEFIPYVRLIADALHLKDWDFEVVEEEPENADALAAIWMLPGRKFGQIYIATRSLASTAEDQRHTIIHELIHCQFAFVESFCNAKSRRDATLALAIEYGVDGMADAVAKFFPMPGEKASIHS